MPRVATFGAFDDLRSQDIRFLQEAAKLGDLHVYLWSDAATQRATGKGPKFPQEERLYLLEAIRFVSKVTVVQEPVGSSPPYGLDAPDLWVLRESMDVRRRLSLLEKHGASCHVVPLASLAGFPDPAADQCASPSSRKKVIATGCYDWFHSGHVRFFEEASAYGDLYVVVGSDANVRHLKGERHPMFAQEERRYVVASIRHVAKALIASGWGWLDAAPEIERLKPDIYIVNEDGDRPEKRAYCQQHGLEYIVLSRQPKDGLPRRQSTDLRGF